MLPSLREADSDMRSLRKGERLMHMDCGQHVLSVEAHICVADLGWRMNALRVVYDYNERSRISAQMN